MSKKRKRTTRVKDVPLLQGNKGLAFPKIEESKLTQLTDDQKCEVFMSKYLELVDPFIAFNRYFETSAKDPAHILRDVKLLYKKLVLPSKWSEKKFVVIINHIFDNELTLNIYTLDNLGRMFEQGILGDRDNSSTTRRIRR